MNNQHAHSQATQNYANSYNTSKANVDTKITSMNNASSARQGAKSTFDTADTAKTTAQNTYTSNNNAYNTANSDFTAKQNAKTTTQSDYDAKNTAYNTANSDFTAKQNAKTAADNAKTTAQGNFDAAVTAKNTAQQALVNATSDLQTKQQQNADAATIAAAQQAVTNATSDLQTKQQDLTTKTNLKDAAIATQQQKAQELQVITDANTTFQTKKNTLDTAIQALSNTDSNDATALANAQAAVTDAQTAYDAELSTNIGTLAKQQLQQNALATKTAAEEAQAKAQAEYDAKIAAEAEAINAYNIAQAQKLADLTIARDDAATNQQQHTIYQNNIKNKFQQSTSHFSKNMSKIFDNMTSIVNSDNKRKGLNNNQRINLDEEFFKPTPFFIPLNTIKYNDNNKTFFKIPNSNNDGFIDFEITFDETTEKFTIVNNNNITLKPNKTEFLDGERVTLDHTYSLVFDKENGIIDGRNNSQLQEALDINNMDNANISDFQEKYKKSMKQINQITINANNEASIHQDIFDFINLKSTTEDKLKEVKNTMNNLFLNEDNKDKKKISDVDMSSIFGSSGIDFDENSIFKNVKKLQVYKGGNDYNTNSFTTTDFFGELTDYQDTDFKTKLENGTKKASYGLLSNKDEKMQIKMGTADTDILKTENGFKINDKEYFNGDRYQKNGYTIEFKDGYIVNSVKDNELEMLQTFDTIDRSKLKKMMNCMNGDTIDDNICKLDDFEDSFKKAGGAIDDISLNKFRKKMIDVIFDTPDNKDLESFIANSETFLKLDKTKLPEKFQTKTKSLVFKDKTEVKLDIKNQITNDANIYIPTEAGVTGKDEIKFDFKDENLKMKHEIEGTGANKVNKYKFTHETKADTAQESGWTIKKYNTGNKLFEDVPTENTFNKDDVLEIEKNNVKYTIHMGSANIQDIQDTNDYTPIVNKGSKLNIKYHTVKNRMFQRQFTSKGLVNAISMSKDKNEELILTHRYKDTTGDRLRRLKSMHIVNSKLSKS